MVPGGVTASVTLSYGTGQLCVPDPQEHTLVLLEPGLPRAVSELLLFLLSGCLLSSMFKALCAFMFAQPQGPCALSHFLAMPESGYHCLLLPPTFPPVSSSVRDLWGHHKSQISPLCLGYHLGYHPGCHPTLRVGSLLRGEGN